MKFRRSPACSRPETPSSATLCGDDDDIDVDPNSGEGAWLEHEADDDGGGLKPSGPCQPLSHGVDVDVDVVIVVVVVGGGDGVSLALMPPSRSSFPSLYSAPPPPPLV